MFSLHILVRTFLCICFQETELQLFSFMVALDLDLDLDSRVLSRTRVDLIYARKGIRNLRLRVCAFSHIAECDDHWDLVFV